MARTLEKCPDTPNCVSTQAPTTDDEHYMTPVSFTGSAADAMGAIEGVVGEMPRTKVVTKESDYLATEFTTAIMRFTDDVEFLVDETTSTIHFRSASRKGSGDLGANRKRMTEVTERLQSKLR